jgi:hypothetical protein
MDCGIHAREWITPAFCQYFVKEVWTCLTILVGTRSKRNKNSKQTKMLPTEEMLLVPMRSYAISRGLRLELVLELGLGARVTFWIRS